MEIACAVDCLSKITLDDSARKYLRAELDFLEKAFCLKMQGEKWMQLGRDNSARLTNDVKSGVLYAYLRQADTLLNLKDKLLEAKTSVSQDMLPGHSFTELDEWTFNRQILDGLACFAEMQDKTVKDILAKLSEVTHDRHFGETSWKASLAADASIRDIQTCAAAHIGSMNMEPLDGLLSRLQEAGRPTEASLVMLIVSAVLYFIRD